MGRALWLSLRPSHWIKQAFVFPGVIFSGNICNATSLTATLSVAACFCLAASSGYLFNDLFNLKEDLDNLRTRHRPLARGQISPSTVFVVGCILALAALVSSWFLGVFLEVASYLVISVAYSAFLKKVFFFDLLSLVSLYLTRLLAGCTIVQVPPSSWLLVCGGGLALLLSWGKRLGETQSPYPRTLLLAGLPALAALNVLFILVYSLQLETQKRFGFGIALSVFWVTLALLRYLRLAIHGLGDPITALQKDKALRWLAVMWAFHIIVVAAVRTCTSCDSVSHFLHFFDHTAVDGLKSVSYL